jgi:hypothetical protein
MSSTSYQVSTIQPYGSSAESRAELFPDSIEAAFKRIEEVSKNAGPNQIAPSKDNVDWAKRVLLQVLPRHYLVGAEIDAFQREIHVNWERGNKRVTVFLPAPHQVKIYCEETNGQGVVEPHMQSGIDPWAVSGVLRWLYL